MITHVNPSYKENHIPKQYHNEDTNTFFTFDGLGFLVNGTMKYWVFGHTHDALEYQYSGVKCICNPMGYPNESYYGDWVWIKTIEI